MPLLLAKTWWYNIAATLLLGIASFLAMTRGKNTLRLRVFARTRRYAPRKTWWYNIPATLLSGIASFLAMTRGKNTLRLRVFARTRRYAPRKDMVV